jgi:hypothetical protein
VLLAPGAVGLYLGFSSGGFFPGATGVAATVLLLVLVLRISLAGRPFEGLGWVAGVSAGALALLAAWTLASAAWSDAPARALLEYNRTLLYLVAVLLAGSLAWTEARLRLAVAGVLVAFLAICVVAFATRTFPDVFPSNPGIAPERLEYPLGYWNALGLLAGLTFVGFVHLTASAREAGAVRVVSAGLVPLLGSTLLLTFSRGAVAVTIAGLVAYGCLARGRMLLTATAATIPPLAVAVVATYQADLLGSKRSASAAAADQGADLALVVGAAAVVAALLRWLLLRADRRLLAAPLNRGRTARRVLAACAAAGAVAAFFVADAPGEVSRQYENFVEGDRIPVERQRERLTQVGNDGRLDQWEVALDAASLEPVHGNGAGTFATLWRQERNRPAVRHDAHSLYVETVAELGWVGLLLIVTAIGTLLLGVARRTRGPDRPLMALVLVLGGMWAVHAGLDWDWEMPVLGVPLVGLCALAAARERSESGATAGGLGRIVPTLFLLVLAITPASIALSQDRLNAGVRAFLAGDCDRAIDYSLDAAAALPVRPEPFQLMGFCDARLGRHALAATVMRNAIRLDPDNWEFRYSLAIVRAAAGRDPRPELRAALELDPRSGLIQSQLRRLGGDDPRVWQRRARGAPLPFQP